MSVLTADTKTMTETIHPWYRYGWPWFLISIPFVSIILGSTMLYLALQANNSLVVDDYYKEGKAYNLIIERDKLASLLGIGAQVRQMSEGIVIELDRHMPADMPDILVADAQQAHAQFEMPESLHLRWVHVTQAQLDGVAILSSIGGSRYIAQGVALPQQGKFRLHIEPLPKNIETAQAGLSDTSSWRLISELTGFEAQMPTDISAPDVNKVQNLDMLK